jgi:hypothetical protein
LPKLTKTWECGNPGIRLGGKRSLLAGEAALFLGMDDPGYKKAVIFTSTQAGKGFIIK